MACWTISISWDFD